MCRLLFHYDSSMELYSVACPFYYRVQGVRVLDQRMLSPHTLYQALGIRPAERQATYRGLFTEPLGENDLLALRKATNDCTRVGNDKFQTEVAAMLARRVKKYAHGGDRRSERYKQSTG